MRFSPTHKGLGLFFAMVLLMLMGFASLSFPHHCQAQPDGLIEGTVRAQQTGDPMGGVNVMAADTPRGTTTDQEGRFQLWLPPGFYRLQFEMMGYRNQIQGPFQLQSGARLRVNVELVEEVIPLDEVVVVGERSAAVEEKQVSSHLLERRQVENLSGTAEDVMRAIQTLPGVVSPADFLGRVFVRGGKTSENVVVLDRVFIYEPYHLAGTVSIFNPELIDHVEFYAGGYPAKYGQATSAILQVFNRQGLERSFRGEVSLSLISANAILEGQLPGGAGRWVLSARRSYHDKLMQAVGAYKNHVFPHFHDLQLKATCPLKENHILTLDVLSSGDALKIELENPDDRADAMADSGDLAWDNQLNLTSLDWKWLISPESYSHLTIAYSKQPVHSEIMGLESQWFAAKVRNVDLNGDLTVLSLENHEIETGFYARVSDVDMDISSKRDYFLYSAENSNVALDTTLLRTSVNKVFRYVGFYVQDQWTAIPPVLSLGYGFRYEAISTSSSKPLSPRFYLTHRVTENTLLKFSWGHYYQFSKDPVQTEPPLGSSDLKPKRAIHYILGLEHRPADHTKVRLEGYVKELEHLFVFGPQMRFANYGRGDVHGLELFLERRSSGRLEGWFSYSYSVAKRKDLTGTREYHPLQDQRHTASLVLTYRPNNRWRFSAKWMVNSGKPYTPVLGSEAVVDSVSGEINGYWPIEGPINSQRFPSYQRLDLRCDRLFQFDGWSLAAYLEVLNLYNHSNVYDYSYTRDYSQRVTTKQFPLLPSLGFKVSF
jgi:hypothetical protein